MPYMICPIGSMSEFDTLEEAKSQALAHSKKYGQDVGGFVVLKVEEVGRYEHVSPIWHETTGPTTESWYDKPSRPETKDFSPEVTIDPVRAPPQFTPDLDDEIPF